MPEIYFFTYQMHGTSVVSFFGMHCNYKMASIIRGCFCHKCINFVTSIAAAKIYCMTHSCSALWCNMTNITVRLHTVYRSPIHLYLCSKLQAGKQSCSSPRLIMAQPLCMYNMNWLLLVIYYTLMSTSTSTH